MHYSKQFLNRKVTIQIDRPMGSKHPKWNFVYPINYGFVPNTKAPDGKEIDAYLLGIEKPVKEYAGICVAIIHRTNDDDDKLIIVPENYKITEEEIKEKTLFQEKYFKSIIIWKE